MVSYAESVFVSTSDVDAPAWVFAFVTRQESLEKQRSSRCPVSWASKLCKSCARSACLRRRGRLHRRTVRRRLSRFELWQFVEKTAHGGVKKVKKWVESLGSTETACSAQQRLPFLSLEQASLLRARDEKTEG
eukprot:2406480-Amphidinium_carterae.1